jgi:hypothetical protein
VHLRICNRDEKSVSVWAKAIQRKLVIDILIGPIKKMDKSADLICAFNLPSWDKNSMSLNNIFVFEFKSRVYDA